MNGREARQAVVATGETERTARVLDRVPRWVKAGRSRYTWLLGLDRPPAGENLEAQVIAGSAVATTEDIIERLPHDMGRDLATWLDDYLTSAERQSVAIQFHRRLGTARQS